MLKKWVLTSVFVAFTSTAFAGDEQKKGDSVIPDKIVRDAIHTLVPTAVIDTVEKSDLPGFYEVAMGGAVVYVSGDGKYLFQGNLFDIANKQDLTEQRMAKVRKAGLEKVPQSKQLVFAPQNPKHTVTVFTDIDCPYCRRFHQQIAEYNKVGIAVNYILFPLSIHPGADKKAIAVWCAADRNAAYSAAMAGQDPGTKTCDNPVAELTSMATAIGVNGTPTMFAEDGSQVSSSIAYDPSKLIVELDRMTAVKSKVGAK